MENPFVFGGELTAAQLVDRRDEVRAVVRAMTERGKLFLVGPRRFGKTSILRVAEDAATRTGAIVLRHDAEGYPTLDALVQALIATAAARVATALKGEGIERTGEKVVAFFSRLRPEVSFNAVEHTWSASIGVTTATHRPEPTPLLVEALAGVARLAAGVKRPVAVVIDEFQKVIELGGPSAEGQLRAAIQRQTSVAYIFAGSKTALLNDMTLNPARPFYRLGGRLFLGPVPRDEFADAIRAGFAAARFAPDADAITHILDLAEDVPYNVQALANMAWELVREGDGGSRRLTVPVVARALDRLVAQDGPFYAALWNQLTAIQQRALLAVLQTGGRSLYTADVLRRSAIGHSTMTKALAALEARAIIRREEAADAVRWRLEDPFIAPWIRLTQRGTT